MNFFQSLLKVKQPSEACSPPGSPSADSIFNTPKFHSDSLEIERLTNENLELKNKILELENELKWAKVNHKIELKSLNQPQKANESAVEKYNDLVFERTILPIADKCKKLILNVLEGLKKGEGVLGCETAENDEEICEFYRESCGTNAAIEELNGKIKDKDKEIRKHKEFIKTLKCSLENILVEYNKSKELNRIHLKEIEDLKEKLAETNIEKL